MKTLSHQRRFHYAWIIFAVCFLSVFTSLGFNSSPKSLYLAAVTEDLGISRSLFSIGNSFRFVSTAIINLFFGKLVSRFGPRRLIAFGYLSLLISNLVAAVSNGIIGFYISNIFLGVGLAFSTTSLVGIVVEKWFSSRKGTIMGFILAANGLGGALSSQILSRMIYSRPDGWRSAYFLAAAIMATVGMLIILLMRSSPSDLGLRPLGDGSVSNGKKRGREWIGIDSQTALHKPYFYICMLCVFLTGLILQSVVGVSSAHMRDQGLSAEAVANAMSVGSLVLMFSKMSVGACFDRFGLRAAMLFCSICSVLSIIILPFAYTTIAAVLHKILISFGLPLETIMLPLIAKECFGQRSYAFLMGLIVSVNTLGYSVGSPLMNLVFDRTGTYSGALFFMAGLMAVTAVVMQLVISAAHRERTIVEFSCKSEK